MGRAKILWIEDQFDPSAFLVEKLTVEGYDVKGVETGTGGLAAMRRDKPDLVLLDLELPDMTGWEVYQRIQDDADLSTIPVVVYTVRNGIDSSMIGYLAGVDAYLPKSGPISEAVAKIKDTLRRSRQAKKIFRPMLRCFLTGGSVCSREISDINRDPYTIFLGYQFKSDYYSAASLQNTLVSATQIVTEDYKERGLSLQPDQVGHREGEHITCEICEKIQRAVFCVFEISNLNPNVMLELGMALGIGRKYALLRHTDSKDPSSDMGGLKYISYSDRRGLTNCNAPLAAEIERYFEEIDLASRDSAG